SCVDRFQQAWSPQPGASNRARTRRGPGRWHVPRPAIGLKSCDPRCRRYVTLPGMVKVREQAFAELSRLPAADQEQLGRSLLALVEKSGQVRAGLDKGSRSLDAGGDKAIDLEELIRQLNKSQ